jgi:hypothetical protein
MINTWMVVGEDWAEQQDTGNILVLKATRLEALVDWNPTILNVSKTVDEAEAIFRAL